MMRGLPGMRIWMLALPAALLGAACDVTKTDFPVRSEAVRAEVADKQDRGNRVTLKIECLVEGKRTITGEAEVVAPSRGS